MSFRTLNATWVALKSLPDALAALPAKRRPSALACSLVAVRLAEVHRDDRGYVDETVDQLLDVLPLTRTQVRAALVGLDQVGWWTVEASGNRHRGARRAPGPALLERGAQPAPKTTDSNDPERGPEPAPYRPEEADIDSSRARGTDTHSAGYSGLERGVYPATPRTPYPVTTTPCNGFTPRGAHPLDGDTDTSELRARRIARTIDPNMTDATLIEVRHQLHEHADHDDNSIADMAAAHCHHLRKWAQ